MQRYTTWRAAAETAGALAAATGTAWALDDHAPASVLALLYIAAVLLVAYRQPYRWAVLACVAAVATLNVAFVHPRGGLRVESQEHGLVLAALLAVSLLAAWLAHRQRTFRAAAERQSHQAVALRELAGDLSALTLPEDMLARTLDHLRARHGLAAVAVLAADHAPAPGPLTAAADANRTARLSGAPLPADAYVLAGDVDPAHAAPTADALLHCANSGVPLGAGTPRWSAMRGCYAPLRSGDRVLGALGVARSDATVAEDIGALAIVADVLTAALLRAWHAAEAAEARAHAHTQSLRSTLLAAVSHDLRTPLAAILGAASALVHQRERLTPQDTHRLAEHIEQEARHLGTITDNTLQWLRLSHGELTVRADWQSADDLLAAAVGRFRQRPDGVDIALHCPADLPLLYVDGVMIAQALSNLLDNAVKYSPGEIGVTASVHGRRLWIDVADRGQTLSARDRAHLGQTFHRLAPHAGIRGSGLGLAISRAIMTAHDGALVVLPRADRGNVFRLDFPIPDQPQAPPT